MSSIDDIAEKVIADARRKLAVLRVEDPMLDDFDGSRIEEWAQTMDERLYDFILRCIDVYVPVTMLYHPTLVEATPDWAMGILVGAPELFEERLGSGGNLAWQIASFVEESVTEKVTPPIKRIAEELGFDLTLRTPDPHRRP